MKPRSSFGFIVLLIGLLAGGAGWTVQWRQSVALRLELERARQAAEELMRLRAENQRLTERQIPAAELERLRADHAALPRLRAELDSLSRQGTPPSR
jgi:hypothetical protein